ncbi:MAG: septal ring lytic transglycosylase RlpA family protein [Pseudomonadota bacterium]
MHVIKTVVFPHARRINYVCLRGMIALILVIVLNMLCHQAQAKKPGIRHCYRGICVQVLTVREVEEVLGKTVTLNASHYDDPSVDPFNRGTFTSNGERFVADDPTRTASANFPDGTELLLRNPLNGRVSHVRVNDFGPFWVNRDLDVTRRVAEDLGFAKQGIAELEVTIVAPPRKEDIPYRRDRQPIPTLGHLGVRTAEETVKLARILLQRLPAAQQKIIFAPDRLQTENVPTMVKRETIFHYVSRQPSSPRALGAEDFSEQQQESAQQVLKVWRAKQLIRRANEFHALAWSTALLMVILVGPITIGLLYHHILTLLGWTNHINFDPVPQRIYESSRSGPVSGHGHVSVYGYVIMALRREMMKRHNVSFDASYVWPEKPVISDATRSSSGRDGLTFDVDYTWPYFKARPSGSTRDDQVPEVEAGTTSSAEATPQKAIAKQDSQSIDELDDDMPAHEKLRYRLDNISQTLGTRSK